MISIIDFTNEEKAAIKNLNYEWLNKYFKIEPFDEVQLSDPETEIINKGGKIFYAKLDSEIVGTASLLKVTESTYELGKMAVTEKCQGMGIGKLLITHCINAAKEMNLEKLILYSNRSLKPAIDLYLKYGFKEIHLDPGHYERADIKMELDLKNAI
jgi:ribosomal protein S18 acetylase RimI-like enzyme